LIRSLVAGFFMRGRMGGRERSNETINFCVTQHTNQTVDFTPLKGGPLVFQTQIRLVLILVIHTIAVSIATASTTWHYTGTVLPAFQNNLGFPVPVGEKASIDITFDPATPNSDASTLIGDYLMSGGDTRFQITIGSHLSTPTTSYRIATIVHGCCASNDQYNFLSYGSQGAQMPISFPGYLDGNVTTQLAFFNRLVPAPITSNALPTQQPDPTAFENTVLSISKNVTQTNNRLIFHIALDPIPEPSSMFSLLVGALLISIIRFRRRGVSRLICRNLPTPGGSRLPPGAFAKANARTAS
jgi:hypothetical protein